MTASNLAGTYTYSVHLNFTLPNHPPAPYDVFCPLVNTPGKPYSCLFGWTGGSGSLVVKYGTDTPVTLELNRENPDAPSSSENNVFELGHHSGVGRKQQDGGTVDVLAAGPNHVVFENSKASVMMRVNYVEWLGTANGKSITLQVHD